jgi:hypothetical protein
MEWFLPVFNPLNRSNPVLTTFAYGQAKEFYFFL